MRRALLTLLIPVMAHAGMDDPSICRPDGTLCRTNNGFGSWGTAQPPQVLATATMGKPCNGKNFAYDKSNGYVLACHDTWQKATVDELQVMADSSNFRKLSPAESQAAAFAEAQPVTLAEGALVKNNGCLYVVRKAKATKDWLLTQVSCEQRK